MTGLGKLGCLGRLGNVASGGMKPPIAQASGRAFPIWNTVAGTDKLLSLSIHGQTEQDGTPTPEVPVPMRSVGDNGLLLSVMQDKTGGDYQLLDIGAAMRKSGHDGILRSVNGIFDEVVYDGKAWKLVQRIGISKGYIANNVILDAENGNLVQYQVLGGPKGGSASATYITFLSNKFYYTGDSTSSKWNNVYGVFTNSLRYRFYCIADKSSYQDTASFKALAEDVSTIYYYVLTTPAEYPLDLPVITTYEGQTYFASNAAEVKPRMIAQCKVSKALDYIREGLTAYYTGRGRSNTDINRNILPDLSGNGNDLTHYNMAYTPDSGYGDGYIQYDGIDDYSDTLWENRNVKSVLLVCEDIVNTKVSPNSSQTSMVGNDRTNVGVVTNGKISAQNNYGYYNGTNLGSNTYTKNFSQETGILNVYIGNNGLVNKPEYIYNLCLGAGNYYLQPTRYTCKLKLYDFLVYNRKLTDDEIEHNYKASRQFNGESTDGHAKETTASGENGFTVYNSLPGEFNELTVYGKSIQDGTPTPENPVDIDSVGDTPLIMTITNGADTQEINFGDLKLRSVNGISDELKWNKDTGKWTLIRRIGTESMSGFQYLNNGKTYSYTNQWGVNKYLFTDAKNRKGTNLLCDKFSSKNNYPGDAPDFICNYIQPQNIVITGDKIFDTVASLNTYIGSIDIIGVLETPIETELDVEAPKTFVGEMTVTTNQTAVQPYMTARTQVSEKIDYVKRGLLAGFDCLNGLNTAEDKEILKDISGNGNDLQLKNFAFTANSGYINGGLLFDGIDDFGAGTYNDFPAVSASVNIKSVKTNKPIWDYFFSFNNTEKEFVLVNPYATNLGLNELIVNDDTLVPTTWWMQGNTRYGVYVKTDAILTNPALMVMGKYTQSANNPANFILKQVLFYSVELTDQEKEQNNKYFKQHS